MTHSALRTPHSGVPGSPYAIPAFFALFLGCVVGAWAWFNVSWLKVESSTLNVPNPGIHLQPRAAVPGYSFVRERLDASVYQTLGTTNIINGTFLPIGPSGIVDRGPGSGSDQPNAQPSTLRPQPPRDRGLLTNDEIPQSAIRNPHSNGPQPSTLASQPSRDRGLLTSDEVPHSAFRTPRSALSPVRVFLASWRPEDGRKTVSILHTPDVCWRLAGWSTLSLGQPNQAWLSIDGRQLPMQSRLFASAGRADREFVMWSTLVDGQPLEPPGRASASSHAVSAPGRASASSRAVSTPGRASASSHAVPTPGRASASSRAVPTEIRDKGVPGYSFPLTYDFASRWIIVQDFWQLLRRRTAVSGARQFLRVSIPLETDWQAALDQVNAFVSVWLKP